IAHLLEKMLNLDVHYKYPEKTELVTAWNTYTNGEEGAAKPETKTSVVAPPVRPAPPKSPPSMSRIGGKPVTPAKTAVTVKPPEPEPEVELEAEPNGESSTFFKHLKKASTEASTEASTDVDNDDNGEEKEEPQEELAPQTVPTKHQA